MVNDQLSVSMTLWVCLLLSVALLATRLLLRLFRRQKLTSGDYWCLNAAIFIVTRLTVDRLILIYGTTRTLSSSRRIEMLDENNAEEASKIIIGSKLVLVTRTLLICVLWSLKMAVLDLLAKLVAKMAHERQVLYMFWTALGLTFIASVATVFVSCRPFERHWQIYPDPGSCVIGNTWLFTYEVCNILTDVLLMAVPCSLILSTKIPMMQRLRILLLFSIGLFLIAISILRIILGKSARGRRAHTLWASLEMLFAVLVAVTPTIYALIQHKNENSTSYMKSQTMKTHTSAIKNDPYTPGAWTELEDDTSRADNTSVEGILMESRFEVVSVKI